MFSPNALSGGFEVDFPAAKTENQGESLGSGHSPFFDPKQTFGVYETLGGQPLRIDLIPLCQKSDLGTMLTLVHAMPDGVLLHSRILECCDTSQIADIGISDDLGRGRCEE